MLICLVTSCRSRRTIRRAANYVRQQVNASCNSDESIRRPCCLTVSNRSCRCVGIGLAAVRRPPKEAHCATQIHEVVVDVDNATSEIVVIIHWKGGVHTEIRVPRRRRGENTMVRSCYPRASEFVTDCRSHHDHVIVRRVAVVGDVCHCGCTQ